MHTYTFKSEILIIEAHIQNETIPSLLCMSITVIYNIHLQISPAKHLDELYQHS